MTQRIGPARTSAAAEAAADACLAEMLRAATKVEVACRPRGPSSTSSHNLVGRTLVENR